MNSLLIRSIPYHLFCSEVVFKHFHMCNTNNIYTGVTRKCVG